MYPLAHSSSASSTAPPQTIANRIMEIRDGKLIDRLCTYDEYIEKQRQEANA